jgi:predicted RNase H-like HicB family nuclease
MIYFGVLEGDGHIWGVWFPDIPGCVSAGRTAAGALEEAQSVLAEFDRLAREDGYSLQPPRSATALQDDPEVQEALAKGDRLVSFSLSALKAKPALLA